MENNNNGRGIFYGVIGVATLVVAIIGATFAYFSATAASNNAIAVGTTTLSLEFESEKRNFRTDMVPVDSDSQYFKLYPGLMSETETTQNKKGKGTCTDDDGNAICGVYEFTIKNPSTTTAQTVYGSLTVTDTGFTNMMYAVFKGAADTIEADGGFDVNQATAKKVTDAQDGELVIAKKLFLAKDVLDDWATNTEQTLAPGKSQTYTVIVWLEEAGDDNNAEQGKTMTAAIKFDTGTGSGITGNLSAAS